MRVKHLKGFTLLELLIGVGLFSLVLTLVALGLQVSQETIAASSREVPVEISLQNAMDGATRLIRQSKDVSGGGNVLALTQWDGTIKNLIFSGGTLTFDTSVIQSGLLEGTFQVSQGEVVKVVELRLKLTP